MNSERIVNEQFRLEGATSLERSVFNVAIVEGTAAKISMPESPHRACVWIEIKSAAAAAVLEELARKVRLELQEREQRALQGEGIHAATAAVGTTPARTG